MTGSSFFSPQQVSVPVWHTGPTGSTWISNCLLYTSIHKELEAAISDYFQTEDTILYAACFDANGGVFEPLFSEEDAIISDSLNHASIIDGVRLCKAKRYRYANADMKDLERCLQEAQAQRFRIIVTDGVFSMDGNVAPVSYTHLYSKRTKIAF